jgi:phage head maturation protease
MNDYIDPVLAVTLRAADPTGEKLKEYWTEGEGAAKIRWGTPGDFDRCVRHLEKYVADPKGYCSDMHQRATGARPGHAPGEQRGGPVVDIEIRATALAVGDVNMRQRIVTLIAVPYDQPAEIGFRGEVWKESFSRSAFDGIEKRPNRVRVNREHVRGDTVGKAIAFYPDRDEGLVADLKIAKTLRGDDTLALAEDDCLSASVGFGVLPANQLLDRYTRTRRINKAWLDHIALVEDPAYVGADVLAVRDALTARTDTRERLDTPVLDDFLADPLIRQALGLEQPSL